LASAKAQLKADLANAKNRAKNAQSRLNAIVANNKQNDLPLRKGEAYDAANQVFIEAGQEVARLTKALAEFEEREKVKTKAELRQEEEELRQADILAGKDPVAEAADSCCSKGRG
jgi:BMFP domain-containing protein YqiC